MGNHLETRLLEFVIDEINQELAGFLIYIPNWNMPPERFKKGEGIRKGQKPFKVKKSIGYTGGIAGCFYDISRQQPRLK